MSRAYKFGDQTLPYFVTFAVVNWIDVFTRAEYVQVLLDSLQFCQINKGLILHGWCIMSSHVHLVIGSSDVPLSDIMRDMKKFTAKNITEAIKSHPGESRKEWMLWMFEREGKRNNQRYQFWQQHNQPIELYTQPFFDQKLEYLHQNPVKAGFVQEAHHWSWSSARNYANRELIGPLEIVFGGW
jgi:REP element-mobilizing transposase RayT